MKNPLLKIQTSKTTALVKKFKKLEFPAQATPKKTFAKRTQSPI